METRFPEIEPAADCEAGKHLRFVVGIGASAGGLEALEQFFEKMPNKTGLAFVVAQQLSPDFRSPTDELARRTAIPIRRVEDGMEVESDTIYLMPPAKEMILSDGRLLLTDKDPSQTLTFPIDHFFRSLGEDAGEGAIGVVLSGTGSDGSRGIRAIHDAGGLVLVQSAETAKFDAMPRSALETGVADFVLPVQEMPDTIVRYVTHPSVEGRQAFSGDDAARETAMETIFRLLRDRYGIDFSRYKPSTMARRIERRLLLNHALDLDDYVKRLEGSDDELSLLYQDLLVGVTRFFRDREAFAQLEAFARLEADVTRLRAVEAQAREAVQQRDRFLAILSHELRNPLSAILNAAQLLQLGVEAGPESDELYQLIDRQAHHMARLLDGLLDASRITQGKIAIRNEVLDLAQVVDEALRAMRTVVEVRGHELVVERPPETLRVEGDRVRLSQVIENLVANSAKYTPDGGRIVVSVGREGDECLIRVCDNGRGIPADMLHSIFDLFVQSDNTLDRADGGMGVGLTLARALVELHGGSMSAHSSGPGRGSEFIVRLPSCAAAHHVQAPPPPKPQGTRVLIVEDNADSRETLKLLLELDGFEVAATETGSEGLEAIRRQRPDVALIDIGLPGLDGYQVAREIRRDPGNQSIRLVALTGYGRPEDRERVKAAGFDAHLVKPVKIEAIYPYLTKP